MNRTKVLKKTLMFFISIVTITIIGIALLMFFIIYKPLNDNLGDIFLESSYDLDNIDLKQIEFYGGRVEVLDSNGVVIKSVFPEGYPNRRYELSELVDGVNGESKFLRNIDDGVVLLSFPKENVWTTVTVGSYPGENSSLIIWIILYMLAIYIAVFFLYKSIKKDIKAIYSKEEELRANIFRGLAHDLKTPLTSILAYTKAIRDGIVPEEDMTEYIDVIINQGEILDMRTKALVSMSAIEGLKDIDNMTSGDILNYTREICSDMEKIIEPMGYEIDVQIDAELKTEYMEELWYRAIENIIFNVVEHNPKGTNIVITWNTIEQSLYIKDDGVGIPVDVLDLITVPFITGDSSRQNMNLNGIGLSITEKILELHNWKLIVNSEEGIGTEVIFKYGKHKN